MERQIFALIISDINLPGESGLELVKYVAQQYPDTVIIMESGIDDLQTAEEALTIGAYGYLIKPFNINQLRIQVFNALRRRELEIENRRYLQNLEGKVRERTQALLTTINHLEKSVKGTISLVASTVELRDPYTAGHQQKVAMLAAEIAQELGLSQPQTEGIRMAGLVHDVGKIFVPAEILSKPGKITAIEFAVIKTHAQVGYQLLKPIDFPWPIADIVHQHHERMDGSGYPRGLAGEEIILEARVMAVADVVEAMASHRPYRPALGIDKALEEISAQAGVLYYPAAVEACLTLFKEKEFGLAWEKIESQTAGFPDRSDGGTVLGPRWDERSGLSPRNTEITPFDQGMINRRTFWKPARGVIPPGQNIYQEEPLKATVSDYSRLEENKPPPVCEAIPISPSDRETLILKHSPLVKYVAQRLVRRLPNHIAIEDLISVGMIGLMDAIQKFDPGRKVNFSTYAEYRIRGAMLDELRAMDWVPRSVRLKKNLLEKTTRELEQAKGYPVEDEEMAKTLGKSLDDFYNLVQEAYGGSAQNLKRPSHPFDSDKHHQQQVALQTDERQDPAFQVILMDLKERPGPSH